MDKHYDAIAKILGGTLLSSNRLQGIIKTFIDYFSHEDENFDAEHFKKTALNGDYIDKYIKEEEPVVEPKVNI